MKIHFYSLQFFVIIHITYIIEKQQKAENIYNKVVFKYNFKEFYS